jgi:hypothetical protein
MIALIRYSNRQAGNWQGPLVSFDLLLHLLQADVPLLGGKQASCNMENQNAPQLSPRSSARLEQLVLSSAGTCLSSF